MLSGKARHHVHARAWRAWQNLGEQQVVDLAAVTGFYVMVPTVITAGRVGIPNNGLLPQPILVK